MPLPFTCMVRVHVGGVGVGAGVGEGVGQVGEQVIVASIWSCICTETVLLPPT
jgi:hypothetical protein